MFAETNIDFKLTSCHFFTFSGKERLRPRGFQSSEARIQKYQRYRSQHERPSIHQTVVSGE